MFCVCILALWLYCFSFFHSFALQWCSLACIHSFLVYCLILFLVLLLRRNKVYILNFVLYFGNDSCIWTENVSDAGQTTSLPPTSDGRVETIWTPAIVFRVSTISVLMMLTLLGNVSLIVIIASRAELRHKRVSVFLVNLAVGWCQRGVSVVSAWCQPGVSVVSAWCQHVFTQPGRRRPDGLLRDDDNRDPVRGVRSVGAWCGRL